MTDIPLIVLILASVAFLLPHLILYRVLSKSAAEANLMLKVKIEQELSEHWHRQGQKLKEAESLFKQFVKEEVGRLSQELSTLEKEVKENRQKVNKAIDEVIDASDLLVILSEE